MAEAATDRLAFLNNKKWNLLRNLTERNGPFCKSDFQPSPDILAFLQNICKILVLGAGGLGCELLKDLAMCGFGNVHVIDMDTVELSNLNRQFLFRRSDIGQSKAECAAKFINERVPSCKVTPYYAKIEDFDDDFYQSFHIIVSGLDSIVARRWINRMLFSMLDYNSDENAVQDSLIPLIDGGTEGFKGNCRLILPTMTACIECTLDLYPPQITYPLCTIANTPRLPEHCIEYIKVVEWDKHNPFGVNLDTDDPSHVNWVYERSLERSKKFNITGVTYRLTLGVLKNIIPAVASTNAVVAAACANEVFKLATSCYESLSNYMVFNNADGIYTYTYSPSKSDDCMACGSVSKDLNITDPNTITLQDVINMLCENAQYRLKQPGISTMLDGKYKTLYLPTVASIEQRTRSNLALSLIELGLQDGQQLLVTDQTTPTPITFTLKYHKEDMEMD